MKKTYYDPWCKPLDNDNGQILYGGAARNVRIARAGGMATIIGDAVRYALERADAAVVRSKPTAKFPRLKAA